jgi:putative membrane protein
MDISNLLLWLHILGFVAGGATAVTMPPLERQLAAAAPERCSELFALGNRMIQVGKVAMGVLLISGPLMWWLKWGFTIPNHWFFAKMGLIVVMLICIVSSGMAFKKMQAGDMSVAGRSAMLGLVTLVAGAGVLLSAVLAFN